MSGKSIRYCLEHDAAQPSNDSPDGFDKCYEWWIGEHVPEAPPLSPCRIVDRVMVLPNEHEFDAGSWERSGRCLCGEALPPQQSWNNAGSEYQSITCGACGRLIVDEEEEFSIYDDGAAVLRDVGDEED